MAFDMASMMQQNPAMLLGLNMMQAGGYSAQPKTFGQRFASAGLNTMQQGLELDKIKSLRELREIQQKQAQQQLEQIQQRAQAMQTIQQIMASGQAGEQTNALAGALMHMDPATALRVASPVEFSTQDGYGILSSDLLGVQSASAPRSGLFGGMNPQMFESPEELPPEPEEKDTGPGALSRLWDWATGKGMRTTTPGHGSPGGRSLIPPQEDAATPPASPPSEGQMPLESKPQEGERSLRTLGSSFMDAFRRHNYDDTLGIVGLSTFEKGWVDKNISQRGEKWLRANWDKLSPEQRAYAMKLLKQQQEP